MRSRAYISKIGIEGALMTLSPFPLLFPLVGEDLWLNKWQLVISFIAAIACAISAFTLFRKPVLGKTFATVAALGSYASALPQILENPFCALAATVLLISAFFACLDFNIKFKKGEKSDHINRCKKRAWWGISMLPVLVIANLILGTSGSFFSPFIIFISQIISLVLYLHWTSESKLLFHSLFIILAFSLLISFYTFVGTSNISLVSLLFCIAALLSFPRDKKQFEKKEYWWEILLNRPARLLLTTFLALCTLGTFLLVLPAATEAGTINTIDAAFTSVSSVCVTGLIVLDTPNDFTFFGQACILLLIQLGGLGIMSIATVALHAMGRRLSLKQERLLTSMTDTDHKDLLQSLKTILKFTFIVEFIGAILLIYLFRASGDSFSQALWRGVFTSISAFCNAGFSLQTDSLIPFQDNALILHTVAGLIVLGGLAPATSLLLVKWLSGKQTPIPARIALVTTFIMLLAGMFFMMAFEWNGVLAGLSINDKIQNAWFQSVTLRTAGFNSVDLAQIASPTFLIMVAFMFIGGSPGGTAGGVKTTTIGILAMTFWSNITSRNDVVIQNRRIHSATIYRAITIVVSGMTIWFLVILMLQVTQQISARDIIFEATSAIGTVGLSIGATSLLDEIGKIIIIIAMFAGRIGPMTLFMVLSSEQTISASRCPEEKISLT